MTKMCKGVLNSFLAIPSTGQIQRSSDGLSHLAAVEVQRVSMSVRRELTASAAHAPP